MNWKGSGRTQSWLGIRLEGLVKATRNMNNDIQFPDRDLNPGPPEYETKSAYHSTTTFGSLLCILPSIGKKVDLPLCLKALRHDDI
jgi:hypothetical protein